MTEAGLRERKKQRTREAIVEAALRLFDERGFEQTTIADIAEAADIAPRTFFGYFPSKEDVVFADFPADFEALAERLRGRGEDETAIEALRAFIATAVEQADLNDERELCRKRVIRNSETLDAHRRALMGRMEDMLAEAIARDFGNRPGDLRPPMIASAAVAALGSLDRTGTNPQSPPTREEALAMIDQALTFLQGGLAALQEASPQGRS
jgi:AcrR family transcriptional regulator